MITKDQPNKYNEIPPQSTSLIEDEIRSGKIDKKMILETSLRSFYTEGSTQAARDNYRIVKEKSAGKAKNIFQKAASSIKNWTEDTIMRKAEETYMALSQGIATITGEKDNLNTLMKLTGDIFDDVHRYPDANIIREEIRARIIERMVNKETKLLGVDGLLQGEAASIAYALSINADNSTDKVLHEFKTDPDGINANYIVDRLTNQILEARNTSAAIEGAENAMAANLLQRTVELQSKVKGSALGPREGLDLINMAARTGLGTMSGLTGVVNKSANVDLSEKKRYDTIKQNVQEGAEFKAIVEKIYKSVKSKEINETEADLVLQEALSKLTFDAYLKVAEKELEVNAAAEETANPKNFFKGLQKGFDAAFGANEITKLLGKGINETQFRLLIPQLQEDLKNVSATEKSDAAKNLLSRIEEYTVFSSDKTDALVKQVRKQMTTITENGLVVAANVVKNTAQMTVDTGAAALFSSPHMTALAGLTNTASMGTFSFSGQKGANLFDGGALDRRMNVVFGTDGTGLNTAQNIQNIIINTASRANPINNIMLSGSNVVGGMGKVFSETGRIAEFSGRVAASTWTSVDQFITPSVSAAENILPQPAKANFGEAMAQVAIGGTDNFKAGDTVKLQVGGSALDGKVLGIVGGPDSKNGAAVIRPNLEGVTVKDFEQSGNIVPKLYDANGNEIKTTFRTAYLMKDDGSGNVATDAKGNKVVVFVTDGDIKGAKQLSENTISSSPTVRADNNTVANSAVKQETLPQNTAKPEVRNNVIASNLTGKFNLTGGGKDNLGYKLMEAGIAEEKNGALFIKQPTSININGRNIVIPAGQYSALTIANAARISDTSIQALNSNPVTVSFGTTSPDLTPQAKPNEVKPQETVINPNSLANSLLNDTAKVSGNTPFISLDQITKSTATSLDSLKRQSGLPVPVEPVNSANAGKPVEGNKDTAGGLRINVGNTGNNFNIYNNADLAATLGNGGYNSGISREVLQEVVRQSNLADLQSRGTVQRLAYLAENKLPLPPELKGLTLSSGAKADAVYEGFVQNPGEAKKALNGVSSVANAATEIDTKYDGKFMVMPLPGGIMMSAERNWNELVRTITVSSITTNSADPTIALPNNSQDVAANTGVKVENGIITARMGVDFKPLSKISLNMGNGINAVIDAAQFPKLMDQLNSRKEVKLSDLLRNVATVNPEVAKAIGAIDTTKAVSEDVLKIKAKDGTVVNLFDAIYKTRGLFNVITNAAGESVNSDKIGSSTRDNNILGPALKTLMNATPERKIAFLNGIKEYNGKYLGPVDIANLSDTARAKWTLNRLFEERNPGILKQDVITNEDLFKLASGLNFSGTKVLEGNLKADVLKAFNHNTTLHPNSIPAAILLRINNSESLAETIKNVEDAELYVRRQNRGNIPTGWKPFLREDISARLRDIAIVQEAMGEKAADITKDHTYEGTIGFGGPGYKDEAFYKLYNLNILPKEASQNFFKANEENPQVTTIAKRAYSNIMGIGIDGVRTGPIVNKVAVAVLSQFVPFSFAYSMEETTTTKQSFSNLSQEDLASAEKVTALAIKFTDPEFAKAYAKFISEKRTPEESLTLALGAKSDPTTGKWIVEGRNGFKLTFNNLDEFNKFSKMARTSAIQVTGAESQNASSTTGVKVFENNPVASVELGGSTLTAKESEELRQYLGNEAKNYDDNMVKARKMLVEAQANRDSVAAKLTATFSANSLRQAMGLGTTGFLATHGEYKGGNKDGVISSTDNDTQANADPDDVKRYSTELNEYRSGKRTSLPDPVMAYLIKCKNFTPIFGQDIPLQASGEISTSGKTETDVNVQSSRKVGSEDVAAAVKPPKPEDRPVTKKEEPKTEEQKELQTENNVQKSNPSATPGGVRPGPQQTGTGVEVKAPTPSATPGANNLPVQPAPTTQNIAAPTPAVQPGANVNVQPLPQVAPQPVAPIPSNIAPATPSIPQVTPVAPTVPIAPPANLAPVIEVPPVVITPPPVPMELVSAPVITPPIPTNPIP